MYTRLVDLLVRGISLPAAQLFVIAIENIFQGCVGNLTSSGSYRFALSGVVSSAMMDALIVIKGSGRGHGLGS